MIGDQWTGSKDSPNFMTLTFNSQFVQDRVPEKGFRLRFNAVGRGIVVSWKLLWKINVFTEFKAFTLFKNENENVFFIKN